MPVPGSGGGGGGNGKKRRAETYNPAPEDSDGEWLAHPHALQATDWFISEIQPLLHDVDILTEIGRAELERKIKVLHKVLFKRIVNLGNEFPDKFIAFVEEHVKGVVARAFDELKKASVLKIGELDAPMLPDAQGMTAMLQHIRGEDMHGRQARRDQVLSTSASGFGRIAEALKSLASDGTVKVVGSAEAVKAYKPGFKGGTERLL